MKIRNFKKPLELTSKNKLILHFLGTGSAFTKKNYQNNVLLIKNNVHIMVDFGTMASQSLYKKRVNVTDLKCFLITHQHADHIGGFEEVALMGKYFSKKKPDLIIPDILEKPLWEYSFKGGMAFNENPNLKLDDFFNIISPKLNTAYPRTAYELNYQGIDLVLFKTNHIPDNVPSWKEAEWVSGLIIDKKVLFTSDTKFDKQMLLDFEQLFKIETIFHDCQLFTGGVHAGYEELKTLPESIKQKMLLTHYGDNWEKFHPEDDGFMGFASPDVNYIFDI